MSEIYWETHDGDGPYLLLVHGFLSSRAQWRLNLDAFRRFSRPVVVELWGHGRSPRPHEPSAYLPAGYLEQFETIRQTLGIERWLMCGQSLGASLTLRYALTYPERVIAQIFTNSNSALATETLTRQRHADAQAAIADIEQRGLDAVRNLRVHPKNARRLPEAVQAELVADADSIDALAIAESYRSLNPQSSVREAIQRLTVPTMLTCGRFEKRFTPLRDFAVQTIPGLQVVDLDAGHAVNIEAADEFNRYAAAFFLSHLETPAHSV